MRLILTGLAIAMTTVACAATDVEPVEAEDDLAVPGRWQLPAALVSRATEQRVSYDYAPPWERGRNCATGPTPGSTVLAAYLRKTFRAEISTIGGFSCRPNTASPDETSVHGTGRALDIMIPMSGRDANNTKGDRVAHWLVEHAEEIGVQYVIWDRSSWLPGDPETSEYTGPVPHIDHVHAEINDEAAAMRTPWFQGR